MCAPPEDTKHHLKAAAATTKHHDGHVSGINALHRSRRALAQISYCLRDLTFALDRCVRACASVSVHSNSYWLHTFKHKEMYLLLRVVRGLKQGAPLAAPVPAWTALWGWSFDQRPP